MRNRKEDRRVQECVALRLYDAPSCEAISVRRIIVGVSTDFFPSLLNKSLRGVARFLLLELEDYWGIIPQNPDRYKKES